MRLGDTEIETLKPVYFDTDRSRVRHAFYNILGQVASMLKAHPEIGRCAVEGHTDSTGPADWNQKLSEMRAQSVVEFLAQKGVERSRLVPIGHAEKLPWVSNDTPEGRAQNRRVMFHIEGVNLEQQQKDMAREERRRLIRIEKERERQKEREAARAGGEEGDESGRDDGAQTGAKPDEQPGEKARDEQGGHGGTAGGAAQHPGPGGPLHQSRGEGEHEPTAARDKAAPGGEHDAHGEEAKPADWPAARRQAASHQSRAGEGRAGEGRAGEGRTRQGE